MKNNYLLLLVVLLTAVKLNAQTYNWSKNFTGNSTESASAVVNDQAKNTYVAGTFTGTIDCDPSLATQSLTSFGDRDIFIAKYDSSGNCLWAKQIGGSGYDFVKAITLSKQNKLYISGQFSTTCDFDPSLGSADITSAGLEDVFLAQYDINGNYLWAIGCEGAANGMGNDVAVDSLENAYMTGYFRGSVDFDPTTGTAVRTSQGSANDIFLAKYDANGIYQWAISLGGASSDFGYGVTVDDGGNSLITGYFSDSVDFDPGVGVSKLYDLGNGEAFVAKYNSAGALTWAKAFQGTDAVYGQSICLDHQKNIYITGMFLGTVDFDPSINTASLTSTTGFQNVFIAKYAENGNYAWAKPVSSSISGNITSNIIRVDALGDVYVAGYYNGNILFDSGVNPVIFSSAGNDDVFMTKYNTTGNYVYGISIGGIFADVANGIAVDANGSYVMAGMFGNTVDFNPSSLATANHTATGGSDVFLVRFDGGFGSVGFSENKKNNAVILYPNPVVDNVSVFLAEKSERADIKILNSLGQLVYCKEELNNNNSFSIDLSFLKSGSYYYQIKADHTQYKGKLLKQ